MLVKRSLILACLPTLIYFATLPVAHAATKVGRFVYAAEVGKVAAYTVNPTTGQLRNIQNVAVTNSAVAITVHPKNKFVYLPTGSSSIAGFRIGTTGLLTAIPGSPFPATWTPNRIAFTPSGNFAYVENYTSSSSLEIFSVNATTGALTSIGTVVTGNGAADLAVTPKGNFIYSPNSSDNTISGFSINPTTGALTAVAGSPFSNGASCSSDWIHSSGKYLYCENSNGSVSGYSINSATGALTPVAGSPFPGSGANNGGYLRGRPTAIRYI